MAFARLHSFVKVENPVHASCLEIDFENNGQSKLRNGMPRDS